MAARKRTSLPLHPRAPSIDAARQQLGGRAATSSEAGRVVELRGEGGVSAVGVVLFASAAEVDVWIERGIVRRTRPEECAPFHGVVPDDLAVLAADARTFARLREGARVRYESSAGARGEGALLEKCRFGALVQRDDGTVMAVGFRKLWPASPDAAGLN